MRRLSWWVGVVLMALLGEAMAQAPSSLLAIDQHRSTVVERIVGEWGDRLAYSSAGLSRDHLREMLNGLRAEQLLAATLVGSLTGLRDVLAQGLAGPAALPAHLTQAKALGDSADDVVYTPVTPCRLVETRTSFAAVYNAAGPFSAGEIRNYTVQGGNGVCLSQLPGGLNPAAVQLQVFGIPNNGVSGDIEVLPQGAAFGSTATLVFPNNVLISSASTTARINPANNQIGVQVRFGQAHVAIDVVGYFKAPSGPGNFFVQGGNAFGTTASLGTTDNQPFEIKVNDQRVMRYEPNATSPNVLGGHPNNSVGAFYAQTVAGGGQDGSGCYEPLTGFLTRSCGNHAAQSWATISGGRANIASGFTSTVGGGQSNTAGGLASTIAGGDGNSATGNFSMVPGGISNVASGDYSFAAGRSAHANANGCFVFSDASPSNPTSCNFPNEFIARALGGVYFFTGGSSDLTYTGAYLNPGSGSWLVYSDRAGKDNVSVVEPRDVLNRLMAVPIATWNWKAQDASIRHMGAMAQDFWAAFGLGESPRGISTVDADGVALAAIQGLHQLVEEKDARIVALERRLAEVESLRGELAALRAEAAVQRRDTEAQRQEMTELRRTFDMLLARSASEGRIASAR
jgi:hypothetical protein